MRYLIAADLEGIHGILGEANKTLNDCEAEYKKANENATLEINTAARALFEEGAELVALWDNHGSGNNLDYSKIDKKIVVADWRKYSTRMGFAKDFGFDAILYLGYHAREGSFNGVLAHTYSSKSVQYVKVDRKPVGELEIDSIIAGTYNIAPIFAASDDVGITQFNALVPDAVSVVTKYGKGRNSAILREQSEVLADIYEGVKKAVKSAVKPIACNFPADLEIRYTRSERAALKYEKYSAEERFDLKYGEDSHILHARIDHILDVISFI